MKRRLFLISLLTALLATWAAGSVASAVDRKSYDTASFKAAQQSGARILVDISATWCPTCKAQKPIIDGLAEQPVNTDLVIFEVDFDSQAPRPIRSAVAEIRCDADSWTVDLPEVATRGHASARRRLPDHAPCERYQVALLSAVW